MQPTEIVSVLLVLVPTAVLLVIFLACWLAIRSANRQFAAAILHERAIVLRALSAAEELVAEARDDETRDLAARAVSALEVAEEALAAVPDGAAGWKARGAANRAHPLVHGAAALLSDAARAQSCARVERLEHMVPCPVCAGRLAPDAQACPHCGHPLP